MNQKMQLSNVSETMKDRDGSSSVKSQEMELIRNWISQIIGSNTQDSGSPRTNAERHFEGVPFSFQCGTRSSRQWLKLEDAKIESSEWEDGKKNYFLRWTDQKTSVSCEMQLTEFQEFPVVEWVVKLRNDGDCASELITNFKAMDFFWKSFNEGEVPELRRSLGSDGRYDDFQYLCDELRDSAWSIPRTIRMDSASNNALRKVKDGSPPGLLEDGRTSATWLPFFNLRTGKDGIIGALGWTGQWFAEFAHDGVGKTDISAGMEHLELKLYSGEEIRSPRAMLLYWHGEPIHGHNVLRKFILNFHSPQIDGKPVEMPICNGAWGGTPTAKHLEIIDAIATHNLPYDYYWIDAGWYGTSQEPCPNVFKFTWSIVGDWRVNKNYHPNGLKPIRDAVSKTGMKFLLWLEVEKALHGTPITLEHPEWFLSKTKDEPKDNDELLLNLGNPEAWQWVVETLSKLIEDNGMDCYRVDFNMDPSPYWRNAEEDGRKGIVEMRFVEGLYAFWDELRRRHPGLLIDNCASGGRRLDLETIGRSVALWRTDYASSLNADALQSQSTGLNLWLPLNSTTPEAKTGDTYQFRSALSAGLVLGLDKFGTCDDWETPGFPWEWQRAMINEAKKLRPYFYGDFYPLTPCVINPDVWMVYQLLLPEKGEGAVLAFRRDQSPMTTGSFQLYGLKTASQYEFQDADSGKTCHETGAVLMAEGLKISIGDPRESRVFFYKELPAKA